MQGLVRMSWRDFLVALILLRMIIIICEQCGDQYMPMWELLLVVMAMFWCLSFWSTSQVNLKDFPKKVVSQRFAEPPPEAWTSTAAWKCDKRELASVVTRSENDIVGNGRSTSSGSGGISKRPSVSVSCERHGEIHPEGVKPLEAATLTNGLCKNPCTRLQNPVHVNARHQQRRAFWKRGQYILQMKEFGKNGQWQEALNLLAQMRVDGVHPDTFAYNRAIDACAKSTQVCRAIALSQEMAQHEVKPDVITYNVLIKACGKKESTMGNANDLFEEMQTNGISPDDVTYNTLIKVHSSAGQWARGLELLKEMQERGVQPDATTYNTAIDKCAKCNKFENAMLLVEDMKCQGFARDHITYNAALGACAHAGQWEQALCFLRDMRDREGLKPTWITYSRAMAACSKGGQWKRATELLRGWRQGDFGGF